MFVCEEGIEKASRGLTRATLYIVCKYIYIYIYIYMRRRRMTSSGSVADSTLSRLQRDNGDTKE